MRQHGPWQIVESHLIYKDPWIELRKDDVIRPDGNPGTHALATIKSGVAVLPLDDDGFVYLTEEFHYGVGHDTIEVVSGGIEPGEETLRAAQRETQEELGITAREWIPMGRVDPFTTLAISPTSLFLARGLTFGEHGQEATERIRCYKTELTTAVEMVLNSVITQGPSSVLILKTFVRMKGGPAGCAK